MEPRDRKPDPLDKLIADTLRERMEEPPSARVWERIESEIVDGSPSQPKWWQLLLFDTIFRGPVAQSAFIVIVAAFLIVQPALYWMHNDQSTVPVVMPYSPKGRPLPAGDLQNGERTVKGYTGSIVVPTPAVQPR